MLYISSDHGGFNLKTELTNYFTHNNIGFEDLGPTELVSDDDYTDYALRVIERVRANEGSSGILICRNGVGVSMLANKFNGIRAVLSWQPKHAASSRIDDHTNVLALPADYIDTATATQTVKQWLETPYSQEARFLRRLAKEEQYGQA